LLGQATERKKQRSYSGSGLFLTNRTESEHERPLLTPAEVNHLPQDDGILLLGGALPYRARKVRYFLDPRFEGRDRLPPPDRPTEQAGELLRQVTSEWDGLAAGTKPPDETVATPAAESSAPAAWRELREEGLGEQPSPSDRDGDEKEDLGL
jgi:type IV secretion system protein VirD4